jgi:hypothetical protein
MGEHVAGTVVGFVVTAALGAGLVWINGKDETEGQRIDQVREEITSSGLEIRHFQEVDLHAGATSYLLTVGRPDGLEPDEVRIYDAEGESFEEAFSFDPKIQPQDSDVLVNPETFEVLAERDVDGDGQAELIGSFTHESATAFLKMPVSIVWDPAQRRYLLRPLLTESPAPEPGRDSLAKEKLEPFESPFEVTDAHGERFEAWVVESVALLDESFYDARGEPLYMGGSFPDVTLGSGATAAEEKLQLAYWGVAIDAPDPSPQVERICAGDNIRIFDAEVGQGEDEEDTIERIWTELLREDKLSRRGEATGERTYVGFVVDDRCVLGD